MIDTQTVFLIKNDAGKYIKTDNLEDAQFVRIPAAQYVDPKDWNDLLDDYELISNQYNQLLQLKPSKNDPDTVTISRSEYNGLQGALRIVKKRSLSQIDKGKADKYGFTFKYADQRVYDKNYPDLKAYCISKVTPVSLNIDLATASFLISKDLKEHYGYIDLSNVSSPSYPAPSKIKPVDVLLAWTQKNDPEYDYDFYVENSDYGRTIKELVDSAPKDIIFDVSKYYCNLSLGVYEVVYWATNPI